MSGQDLELFESDDHEITVSVVDEAGVAVDLTGLLNAWFSVGKSVKAVAPFVIQKTLGSGVAVVAPATLGKVKVTLSGADTALKQGTYYYELRLKDGAGKFSTVAHGKLTLNQTMTPNA